MRFHFTRPAQTTIKCLVWIKRLIFAISIRNHKEKMVSKKSFDIRIQNPIGIKIIYYISQERSHSFNKYTSVGMCVVHIFWMFLYSISSYRYSISRESKNLLCFFFFFYYSQTIHIFINTRCTYASTRIWVDRACSWKCCANGTAWTLSSPGFWSCRRCTGEKQRDKQTKISETIRIVS